MIFQDLFMDALLPRIHICRYFEPQNTPDWSPRTRTSEFYEISYYAEGNGIISINNKPYHISAGDIRFIKPGTILYSLPPYKAYTVYFDFGQSKTIYRHPLLDEVPEFSHTNGEQLHYFEELLQCFHSNDMVAPIRQKALLLMLLSSFFESIYSKRTCCNAVKSCITYMEENYSQNITLETLSRLSDYSKIHISRLFKTDLGCSPHEYLTSIRIKHAKRLLTDTNLPIPTIATECGFSSDSHFKTLFRETTGLTPGNYRKNANT